LPTSTEGHIPGSDINFDKNHMPIFFANNNVNKKSENGHTHRGDA
jgi:hypothetical protein